MHEHGLSAWLAQWLAAAVDRPHTPQLPHCRDIEVLHIPKTSGISLIFSLAELNASFCFTETGGSGGLISPRGRHLPGNSCRACPPNHILSPSASGPAGASAGAAASPPLERIGVHERHFGSAARGRDETLYLAIVREPESWLRSAIAQECNTEYDGRGRLYRHSIECQTQDFLPWYTRAGSKFYFANANLQAHMLGNIWQAPNYVVCALEQQWRVAALLGHAVGLERPLPALRANTAATKPWSLSKNGDGAFNFSRYAHMYQADTALYHHVASAPGGCLHRLTLPRWSALWGTLFGSVLPPDPTTPGTPVGRS